MNEKTNENLRRYYLEQLDISLWEKRLASSEPQKKWVIVSDTLTDKAEKLLNAMLLSIGKKQKDVDFMSKDEFQQNIAKISLQEPKVILVLGDENKEKWPFLAETQMLIIVSYSLANLLKNPSDKSKAFLDWLRVKKQLE